MSFLSTALLVSTLIAFIFPIFSVHSVPIGVNLIAMSLHFYSIQYKLYSFVQIRFIWFYYCKKKLQTISNFIDFLLIELLNFSRITLSQWH